MVGPVEIALILMQYLVTVSDTACTHVEGHKNLGDARDPPLGTVGVADP